MKLNLGAGKDIKAGWVNVDMLGHDGIDVVHNLMEFPYPFDDGSATNIWAQDVVEHLDNYTRDYKPGVVAFIEECHRILERGGEFFIQTPHWTAPFLWVDPTHVRGFDMRSFDFFDPEREYGMKSGYYSPAKFKVQAEMQPNRNVRFWLIKR